MLLFIARNILPLEIEEVRLQDLHDGREIAFAAGDGIVDVESALGRHEYVGERQVEGCGRVWHDLDGIGIIKTLTVDQAAVEGLHGDHIG